MRKMFENKVVIVIGATGGIGEVISKRLADENAKIILFSRNSEKLDSLAQKSDTESLNIVDDATNYSDLEKAVNLGVEKFGKIDSLIHAVGSIVLKPIHNTDEETFRETTELNLISPFLAIKSVIKKMMNKKAVT